MKKIYRITTIPLSLEKLLGEQLTFINQHIKVTALSSDEKELKRVPNSLHIEYQHVEMTRQITPIKDIKALWKLYKILRKDKPEIVHTHTPKAGIIGMLAARLAGIPIRLHTVAGLPLMETSGKKRKILEAVEQLTYRCATRVYPNSEGLMKFIIQNKFTSIDKLKIIGNGSSNGINTDYFNQKNILEDQKKQLKTSLNIDENDFVFIFVGRLVGDKGINELIKAYTELDKTSTKLLLVGPLETELDPLLESTLQHIKSNSNIIHVGYQQDVRPYFSIANSLVFPSYREGFPNVVMQAGAMDLPSVVTDINGCNEIIIEGENGTIIPVKNTAALYKAMEKMLRDEEGFLKMKENARRMITSRYEQSVVWSALLEEYQKIIS